MALGHPGKSGNFFGKWPWRPPRPWRSGGPGASQGKRTSLICISTLPYPSDAGGAPENPQPLPEVRRLGFIGFPAS
jgi:hypothetical protein